MVIEMDPAFLYDYLLLGYGWMIENGCEVSTGTRHSQRAQSEGVELTQTSVRNQDPSDSPLYPCCR